MSNQPYWNTPDNYTKYHKDKSESGIFCPNCNRPKPTNQLYCKHCSKYLLTNGLEKDRIKLGTVGRATIPYQQSLHTRFFKCNAPLQYRGAKEDRIYTKLKEHIVANAVRRLDWLLKREYFTYEGKTYRKKIKHRKLYKDIKHIKNITRRLLYNITLYFLHYANSNDFKSLAHFQSSMIANLHINIENTHMRTFEDTKQLQYINQVRSNYSAKYYYNMWNEISKIVEPIIGEMKS